ncbi:RluA family pseudouridine synthase [Bacillus sp. AGMB 02131]|uniref:Pseudouridine synthase n=1 Tax=Peribacillus faecalis TaxID=2772559 RepID=A0A927HE57_9BACI|nr:RluA family pseudouridine synthase [Peribacillus faecalis]MBD3110168.1 RluA family pseudouridine synthase [Peribacillus faecalis]
MKAFELSWKVAAEQDGMVLREYLKGQNISKAALTDIKFQGGKIEVNGHEETVRYIVKQRDKVTVQFPPETCSDGLIAEDGPLDIVYEDDYVLVINKPAFMSTIPSREHPTGSVANIVAGYYEKQCIPSTVHVVTRLDRDTSGIMLIAKHRHVHHLLSEQQKRGDVKRTYAALVHGRTEAKGKIEEPIGRKSSSIIEREVREDGQYACTLFERLQVTDDFSYVQLRLMTGRTHQIRVHMAYIGHPLLGDDLYGGTLERINRQALHCRRIQFLHPMTGELMVFEADLVDDMKRLLK